MIRRPPRSTLFPYNDALPIYPRRQVAALRRLDSTRSPTRCGTRRSRCRRLSGPSWGCPAHDTTGWTRSEEHTSELQSRLHLVCRLLLEKKKKHIQLTPYTTEN